MNAQQISGPEDFTLELIRRVAFEYEPVALSESAAARISSGRARFEALIEQGVPCYGVTSGLGRLSDRVLDEAARADLPRNILRARAAAFGEPFAPQVSRAVMLLKLANFVSGSDGVSVELAQYIVDRLNDGFTPWIPGVGHGMAADATGNTHCFQTLIGEGYVFGDDGERVPAGERLKRDGLEPFAPGQKEGISLLNGIAIAPAYALYVHDAVSRVLAQATGVAAASIEGIAAPRDSIDPALVDISAEPGSAQAVRELNLWLAGSEVVAHKLQSPISYRIVPQVHGAATDALASLGARIERQAQAFSDNPYLTDDDRFLSCGVFHNQHLVNAVEQASIALAHVACLSERRLHRLLDPVATGLSPQLAARPGLDAGLVVVHKAIIDCTARVRMLSSPVSLMTSETSAGQEDYMSMAVPAISRLDEIRELTQSILAGELLAATVALDQRQARVGDGVQRLHRWVREAIAPLDRDRSPGPDMEALIERLSDPAAGFPGVHA